MTIILDSGADAPAFPVTWASAGVMTKQEHWEETTKQGNPNTWTKRCGGPFEGSTNLRGRDICLKELVTISTGILQPSLCYAAEAITNQPPPLGLRRATRRLSTRAAAAQWGRVATWYKASVVSSWSKAKREAVGACRRRTLTRTPKVATKERVWQGERFRGRPLEEGGVQGSVRLGDGQGE